MGWFSGDSTLKEITDLESKLTGDREVASGNRRRIVEIALDGMTKSYNEAYGKKAEFYLRELVKTDRVDSRAFWALFERFGKAYETIGKRSIFIEISGEIWNSLESFDIKTATPEVKKSLFEAMQHYKDSCRTLKLHAPI